MTYMPWMRISDLFAGHIANADVHTDARVCCSSFIPFHF
jgi:hypothetical protein